MREGKGLLAIEIIGLIIVLIVAISIGITGELPTMLFYVAMFGVVLIGIGGYGYIIKTFS